jgi:peptide subunit release factor RF-3
VKLFFKFLIFRFYLGFIFFSRDFNEVKSAQDGDVVGLENVALVCLHDENTPIS